MSRQTLRYSIAVFFEPSFLTGQRKSIIYLLIAYTLVTILGFVVLNSSYGPLGIITKIDEILLSAALWMYKGK